MAITEKKIIKIIQDKELQQQFFDSDYFENIWEDMEDEELEAYTDEEGDVDEKLYLKAVGLPTNYKIVASRCDTSEMWAVIYFPNEDIYIKITGTYDSYGEYDHYYDDEVTQVFPKEITTTIYE